MHGAIYPVNELFYTIQGEATYTGYPSVFIRLQGCNVGCPWCDTKHTWDSGNAISIQDMLNKDIDSNLYAPMSAREILEVVKELGAKRVVITGGEPCMHDLEPLTTLLATSDIQAQIETSGTEPIRCDPRTWVTVSPKIGMPGQKTPLFSSVTRANEIKMPVGKMDDLIKLQELLDTMFTKRGYSIPPVWLQPLSQGKKATSLCIEAAKVNNWRVSIQTHKYIGVR